MSEQGNRTFGPNPERYEKLSEPVATREEADANVKAFMEGVDELRERYHIPELIIHFEINVLIEGEPHALRGGCGWGNQLKQARLAKQAADREFKHLGDLIEGAALVMPELWQALITDPVAQAAEPEGQADSHS